MQRILLGSICALALGITAMSASPALAKFPIRHKLARKQPEHAKLPFGEIPKGPLEIFVSIDQQRLHFYSGGVHIADEPVATGVPGHLTPLGIFDVIQRDRYHHSNIYDNAPMPFMERITWSGVALHEGVGLGHQASHGCIRMPHDFAARLWMLHTMGMRVVIARPELRPVDFADPHLFVHKDAPTTPAAALPPATETAQVVKAGTGTDALDPGGLPVAPPAMTPKANAAPGGPAINPASPDAAATKKAAAGPAEQPTLAQVVKNAETTVTRPPAASAASVPVQASVTPSASVPAQPASPAPMPGETASLPSAPADISAPISAGDVPLPPIKPAQFAHESHGPIAIFISRKEKKIYVRQNFMPLFDSPVTIEDPDQPLGTHLFTAMDYLPDHSTLHWTEVSLPADVTKVVERWKYVWDSYGRRIRVRVQERVSVPAPSPETPQDALARIDIPKDVVDQISRLIVPGSSLIISDQGLGPETGDGTDFIVVTR